ncbi:MAG: chloride channel protein [Pseudomonadota bacterium]
MALSVKPFWALQVKPFLRFWLLALLVGLCAGAATLGFRVAISNLQSLFYGADDVMLASVAKTLPWWLVLVLPICGGLIVGMILHHFTPDGRARGVADVIDAVAQGDGRVERRAGLASALASLITLSTGGSTGREGPVVHLGAVISSKLAKLARVPDLTGRDLLGCAVAAAVSASFNAPIAGAIFALEVILRQYSLRSFAPIVIASIGGTMISRLHFGDITEFTVPPSDIQFFEEIPAFILLGLTSGIVAVVMIRAIFWTEDRFSAAQSWIGLPGYLRPACAGVFLGAIAIYFPHIIGVGYETTARALEGDFLLHTAIIFAVVKTAAVAITFGGRMGGGVFSPALMMGALTGVAFGQIATPFFPEVSGSLSLYALAGMGAVSAAVLGAPISTTLIAFELTGLWQVGLAVILAVSISTSFSNRIVYGSFFLMQLVRRGRPVSRAEGAGREVSLFVGDFMRPFDPNQPRKSAMLWRLVGEGQALSEKDSLTAALRKFERGPDILPVIEINVKTQKVVITGALHRTDAITAVQDEMVLGHAG